MVAFNPSNDIPDLSGKIYLITGGTAGLGEGSITNLAAHNPAHIFFTGRKEAAANELIEKTRQKCPGVGLTFIKCDNTKLASVQDAAHSFLAQSDRLDVLICNAGIMSSDPATTEDGCEVTFQTNHLAHGLLIKILMPTLENTSKEHGGDARVITLTSTAYQLAPFRGIEFATLNTKQDRLGNFISGAKWARYGQSKLANLLYPQAIIKHHPQVTAIAVHPGVIKTEMVTSQPFMMRFVVYTANPGQTLPIERGPYSQLWAATTAKNNLQNGRFYTPVGKLGTRMTGNSRSNKLTDELWEWTQKKLEGFS